MFGRVDFALWFAILAMEITIAVILVRRHAYRLFPMFSLYLIWTIISDIGMMIIQRQFSGAFDQIFIYEISLDSALQFGVLVELAWSVVRPLRRALPRWTIAIIAVLILLAGTIVWPVAGFTQMRGLPQQWHFILHLQQTFSILRILFFVVLAGGSQLFSIGWRDRELQIATGLGFYSLASLAAGLLHAQMPSVANYHKIDQFVTVIYLCSLAYWVVSFVRKEAPRQEFTPQMQSFLLRVSGVAQANRLALENQTLPRDPHP